MEAETKTMCRFFPVRLPSKLSSMCARATSRHVNANVAFVMASFTLFAPLTETCARICPASASRSAPRLPHQATESTFPRVHVVFWLPDLGDSYSLPRSATYANFAAVVCVCTLGRRHPLFQEEYARSLLWLPRHTAPNQLVSRSVSISG